MEPVRVAVTVLFTCLIIMLNLWTGTVIQDESVENDDGDGECTVSRHDYDGHVDDEPTAGADLVKQSIDSGDEYEKGSNVTSVEDMDMDVVKAIDDENDGVCDIEMRVTNDMDSSIGGELESLVTIRSEDVDK